MREITFFSGPFKSMGSLISRSCGLILLIIIFISGFAMNAQAPPDVADGMPGDWPSVMASYPYPYGSYIVDPQNDPTDDIWTEGSSDVGDINSWTTTTGTTNDKNDLKNTGAVTIYDPVSASSIIYFFADRYSSKGDSQLGYWLLQGTVERTGSGFVGTHQDGDVLLRTNFKKGGTTAVREVFIWLNGQLQEINLPETALNFTSNTEAVDVPDSWSFDPKSGAPGTYPPNSFVEGFLNLTELESAIAETFEFDFDPCFSYFLISTGQSQSETSSLADLVSGKYGSKPGEQELVGSTVCSDQDNVGTVTMLDSEINILYQIQQLVEGEFVNVLGQDPIHGSVDGQIEFTGLSSGDYYVNAYIGNSECETRSGPVSVVVNVVNGGEAGSAQTICAGEDPEELSVTGASGDGTVSYQWQYSTNGIDFSDIENNSQNVSYDPGALYLDTWFQRVTTYTLNEVECVEASSPVKVTVNNIDGGTIGAAQAICEGDTPDTLNFQAGSEASGDGNLSYQWEYSNTGEDDDFQMIPEDGAGASFSPGALTTDTWYRVVTTSVLDDVACNAISNKIKITVNDLPVPIDADIEICEDETDTVLSNYDDKVLGDQVGSVSWYNGDPANGGQEIDSSKPFDLTQNDIDLFAKVTLSSTKCQASVDVSLTVNPLPEVEIMEPPAEVICITELLQANSEDESGELIPRLFQAKVDGEIWTADDLNGTWTGDVTEDGYYDPTKNPGNPDKTINFTYIYPETGCEATATTSFRVEEPEITEPIETSICIFDIPSGGIEVRSKFLEPNENGKIEGEVSFEMNGEYFNGNFNPGELGEFSISATYNLENKACIKTINIIITVTDCLNCDTAFARPAGEDSGTDNSYCFIDEIPPYGEINSDVLSSERWGWTNLIKTSDFTLENDYTQKLRLYAGAGGCDVSGATDIGELNMVYNEQENNMVITYEIERGEDEIGYIFSGAHLYVGEEPYPSKKKGKTMEYTVAPGKYPFNTRGGMEPTYKIVYAIEDVLPEFYLIAHASACTSFTKEFMDELWENAEVEIVSFKKNDNSMITASGTKTQDRNARLSSTSLKETSNPLFKVAPVPFSKELNVEYLFDYTSDVSIQIYDMNGRLMRTYTDKAVNSGSASQFNIDFKTRSGKLYILRMTTDREIFSTKIISGK